MLIVAVSSGDAVGIGVGTQREPLAGRPLLARPYPPARRVARRAAEAPSEARAPIER